MTQEVSQVQGQIQPNGFVTSRHLTSLSTEVKASAEDFPVVRLYIYKDSAHLGFSHSTTNCRTATFHIKEEVRNQTCLKESGKNPSPQSSCLPSQRLWELSFIWNVYLSIKFSWNQPTGWKVTGVHTFTHTRQSCLKLISRGNQANNTNPASSFSTKIWKTDSLERLLLLPTTRSFHSTDYNATDNIWNNKFHEEKD